MARSQSHVKIFVLDEPPAIISNLFSTYEAILACKRNVVELPCVKGLAPSEVEATV